LEIHSILGMNLVRGALMVVGKVGCLGLEAGFLGIWIGRGRGRGGGGGLKGSLEVDFYWGNKILDQGTGGEGNRRGGMDVDKDRLREYVAT
jgi:hypothetical protein